MSGRVAKFYVLLSSFTNILLSSSSFLRVSSFFTCNFFSHGGKYKIFYCVYPIPPPPIKRETSTLSMWEIVCCGDGGREALKKLKMVGCCIVPFLRHFFFHTLFGQKRGIFYCVSLSFPYPCSIKYSPISATLRCLGKKTSIGRKSLLNCSQLQIRKKTQRNYSQVLKRQF